jgi:hypothetical protein
LNFKLALQIWSDLAQIEITKCVVPCPWKWKHNIETMVRLKIGFVACKTIKTVFLQFVAQGLDPIPDP